MKNVFKLWSVFMAMVFVVSTLLFTGVLASADPTEVATDATATGTAVVTEATGDKVISQWKKSTATLTNEYIYILPTETSDAGVALDTFWSSDLVPNLAANRYVDIEFNGNFTGTSAATAQIKSKMFAGTSSMRSLTSVSENKLLLRVEGKASVGAKAQIDLHIPGIDETAFRFDNLTITLYEGSGSIVTSASGATSGGGSKPTGTPGALQKTVLWDGDVTATVTVNNYRGALNNADIDTAIRQDVANNGTIVGDEYYEIITTGYMQGQSGYAVAGFATGDYEFWGNGKAAGCAVIGTSAGTTTQKCAAGDTDKSGNLLADKMNSTKTQFVFFSEADGYKDTVYVSHITINVYRQGEGPAPIEPSASESKPSASESEPVASESEPIASESEPVASESGTAASESGTAASESGTAASESGTAASESGTAASESGTAASESGIETDPAATETGFDATILGDANGDGVVNMKDVLALRKYIAGLQVEIDLATADANADGDINMKDVLAVRKYIAGLLDHLGA